MSGSTKWRRCDFHRCYKCRVEIFYVSWLLTSRGNYSIQKICHHWAVWKSLKVGRIVFKSDRFEFLQDQRCAWHNTNVSKFYNLSHPRSPINTPSDESSTGKRNANSMTKRVVKLRKCINLDLCVVTFYFIFLSLLPFRTSEYRLFWYKNSWLKVINKNLNHNILNESLKSFVNISITVLKVLNNQKKIVTTVITCIIFKYNIFVNKVCW